MMKIEGFEERGLGLLLTMPFTVQNKDYISGWLAAGSDDKYYGKLVLYRFTNVEKNAYGTIQMENRIDNDPTISSQTKLWGDENSTVVRGNMIIVPIKDSLLYVEPVYITTSNTASFPELKRIIVAYKGNYCNGTDLTGVLLQSCLAVTAARLAPAVSQRYKRRRWKPPVEGGDGEAEQLLRTVVDLYERYKQYNAENDFEKCG